MVACHIQFIRVTAEELRLANVAVLFGTLQLHCRRISISISDSNLVPKIQNRRRLLLMSIRKRQVHLCTEVRLTKTILLGLLT